MEELLVENMFTERTRPEFTLHQWESGYMFKENEIVAPVKVNDYDFGRVAYLNYLAERNMYVDCITLCGQFYGEAFYAAGGNDEDESIFDELKAGDWILLVKPIKKLQQS